MSTLKRTSARWLLARMVAVLAIITPVTASAVSGDISTNTTWSGTVQITGDVRVLSGVTLTVSAGTQVSINPSSSTDISAIPAQQAGKVDICVLGTLQVNGTSGSHVVFASNAGSPTGTDWYQLVASSSGSVVLNHAEVRNCEYGLALGTTGLVSVSECEFEENDDDDITIASSPSSCSISASTLDVDDGAGIKIVASAVVTISGCTITGNGSSSNGIDVSGTANVTMDSNNISGFSVGSGVLLAAGSTGTLKDNHIESCLNGLRVTASSAGSATAYVGASGDGNEIETCTNGILVETIAAGSCPGYTPYATIRYNWIHGNTNGIKTAKTGSGVDAGTNGDYGYNTIESSSSYGVNNNDNLSNCGTVNARGNNWGRNGSNECIAAVTYGSVDANEIYCPGGGGPGGCHDCPQGVAPIDAPRPTRTTVTSVSPNPFNPETTINFTLGESSAPTITIYDVAGRLIRGMDLGLQSAGPHASVWDGRDNQGNSLASGIYFIVFRAGAVTDVRKAVLLK